MSKRPEILRKWREKHRLNQSEMASILSLKDRRSVNRYENGKSPVPLPIILTLSAIDAYMMGTRDPHVISQAVKKIEAINKGLAVLPDLKLIKKVIDNARARPV